jgi:hypothetical protein
LDNPSCEGLVIRNQLKPEDLFLLSKDV